MNDEVAPLQKLADILVSKKEIQQLLQKRADAAIAGALGAMYSETKARASARRALEAWLRKRGFSNFGREKMIKKVIAKALKKYHYSFTLRAKQFEAKKDEERERRWRKQKYGW
jgi:hypothetical protein